MKKTLCYLFVLLCLCSCSGSDTYRGAWKATNANGVKFELTFEAKKLSIKDSSGKVKEYEYVQNSVSIKNSIETYGIHLRNGQNYLIHFPLPDDESKAVITDESDNPMYTIGKEQYVGLADLKPEDWKPKD